MGFSFPTAIRRLASAATLCGAALTLSQAILPGPVLAEAKSTFGAGHDPGRNGQKPQTVAAANMRQLMSLVEYVGGDYAGAVHSGKVTNQTEYEEISQFTVAALDAFSLVAKARPKTQNLASIEQELRDLKAAVADKKDAHEVRSLARSVREHLIDAFQLTLAPAQVPQKSLAISTFGPNCASCHGDTGRGDGILSAKLDPRPRNFSDLEFAAGNSPFKSFNVLHTGVSGTPMASFSDRLSTAEMWSLSFWISGLAHDQGATIASLPEAVRAELKSKVSLEHLSRASDDELISWVRVNISSLKASGRDVDVMLQSVVAALRVDAPFDGGFVRKSEDLAVIGTVDNRPEIPAQPGIAAATSIEATKLAVTEAMSIVAADDFDAAKSKLLDAYLVGFEPAEKSLRAVDPGVVAAVEQKFVALRSTMTPGTAAKERDAALAELNAALDQALAITRNMNSSEARASNEGNGDLVIRIPHKAIGDFLGSFLIIFREGFEAFLIIAALLAALGNMGMNAARKWIHVGWGAAIVLGVATFFILNHLVRLSGMEREMVEAVATGLAAVVLFYVGFWLLSQAERSQWDKFIRGGAKQAVTSGKVWTLAGLAFIAVYREAAETVLFYNALSNSASSSLAVTGGFVTGAASLGGICFAIQRYGLRMPLRKFFLSTSFLMVTLSVILAGKAVAELIESGMLEPVRVGFVPTMDLVGIYPYAQTLLAQALFLAIAGGIWVWKQQAATKSASLSLSAADRSGN